MKKAMLIFLFVPLFVHAHAQAQISLDEAVQNGASYLQSRFPRGTRAAVIAVQSENIEAGAVACNKISSVLVNSGWFAVVERNAAALESLSREMSYQLSGEISDETSLSIGRQLGAEIIVSGSLSRLGQNWRLELKALRVESAQLAGQWASGGIRPDPAWASLRSASLFFAGDTMAARDRQIVAGGLRNAIQTRNISLNLDENSNAGAGYGLTVTVYREPAGTAATPLLKAEATVAFSQGGRVLCQSGPHYITETTEALIARRIAERLSGDQVFFNRIKEIIR